MCLCALFSCLTSQKAPLILSCRDIHAHRNHNFPQQAITITQSTFIHQPTALVMSRHSCSSSQRQFSLTGDNHNTVYIHPPTNSLGHVEIFMLINATTVVLNRRQSLHHLHSSTNQQPWPCRDIHAHHRNHEFPQQAITITQSTFIHQPTALLMSRYSCSSQPQIFAIRAYHYSLHSPTDSLGHVETLMLIIATTVFL